MAADPSVGSKVDEKEEKKGNANNELIVKNPLVAMIGIKEFPKELWRKGLYPLPAMHIDYTRTATALNKILGYDFAYIATKEEAKSNTVEYCLKREEKPEYLPFAMSITSNDVDNFINSLQTRINDKDCKYDGLILIWSGHGNFDDKTILYCSDGKTIAFEEMASKFSDDLCPSLARCPRIFILDACRGSKRLVTRNVNTKGGNENKTSETNNNINDSKSDEKDEKTKDDSVVNEFYSAQSLFATNKYFLSVYATGFGMGAIDLSDGGVLPHALQKVIAKHINEENQNLSIKFDFLVTKMQKVASKRLGPTKQDIVSSKSSVTVCLEMNEKGKREHSASGARFVCIFELWFFFFISAFSILTTQHCGLRFRSRVHLGKKTKKKINYTLLNWNIVHYLLTRKI